MEIFNFIKGESNYSDIRNALIRNIDLVLGVYDFLQENVWDDASKLTLRIIGFETLTNTPRYSYGTPQRRALIASMRSIFEPAYLEDGYCCPPTDDELFEWHQEKFNENIAFYKRELTRDEGVTDFESERTKIRLKLESEHRVISGYVHTALDLVGLIPFLGEPADAINTVLYIIEGDGMNAALSAASMLPVVGWLATGLKVSQKFRNAKGAMKTISWSPHPTRPGFVKFTPHPENVLDNGRRANTPTWKDFWGLDEDKGHHLIPRNFWDHDMVQKAAKEGEYPYHIHHKDNGYGISTARHAGSHGNYDDQILSKMDDWMEDNPEATADEVKNALINFQQKLRNALDANPNTNVNDLIVPDF